MKSDKQMNEIKEESLVNCAPFTNCKIEINNGEIDNAKIAIT